MNFRALLSHFRRPEKKPLTPVEGKALVDKLAATLFSGGGLEGFLIAAMETPGTQAGEVVTHVHAVSKGMAAGLTKVFSLLRTTPETKDATLAAFVAALETSGVGRPVQLIVGADDCDCSICAARRAVEGTASPRPNPINH